MPALSQLAIIWCGVFFAVFAARKTRLTPVLFFLFVGALLVNIGVLPIEADPFITGFADIGIVVIMFAIGFEENTANFLQSIRRSWGIAFFGALAPFFAAFAVADYFWGDTQMSLIFGLTMTMTAVSLTMVSLRDAGLERSRAATGIMTSAVLDNIGSLVLVAILVPVATGEAPSSLIGIVGVVAKAVLFFVVVVALGGWVFPHHATGIGKRIPLLRRYGLRHLLAFGSGEHATLTVLTIALLVGVLALALGFHPAVGAYMAGLVIKEEYFSLPKTGAKNRAINHFERTRKVIDNAAYSWIGPVFFVNLGTRIVFDWDLLVSVIPETLALTLGLFVAQTASAALAARYTAGFDLQESMLIGFGMLGRAELAFVVMDIAYVQNAILSDQAFYTLMSTAFLLNVSVPVTIAWWKRRLTPEPGH